MPCGTGGWQAVTHRFSRLPHPLHRHFGEAAGLRKHLGHMPVAAAIASLRSLRPPYQEAHPRSLESLWAGICPVIGGVGSCRTLFKSRTRFCLPTGFPLALTSHLPQGSGQLSNCRPVGIRLGRFLWPGEPTLDWCFGLVVSFSAVNSARLAIRSIRRTPATTAALDCLVYV